jgi:hypothetical protein
MKGSLSSSFSLNSENPYATITDTPGSLAGRHNESSYEEMKSPAHREHVAYRFSAAVITATASTPPPPATSAPARNVYDMGRTEGERRIFLFTFLPNEASIIIVSLRYQASI